MENRPGLLMGCMFLLAETFALLLYLFGAPVIVWLPVAMAFPVLMIVAAVKVTYDMWRKR